jgi:broad specificity phosphatase PhoE
MKVHIFRHCKAEHNVNRDYSIFDPKLIKEGEEQCARRLKEVVGYSPEIVLVSPSTRTLQTSQAIFGKYPTFACNLLVEYHSSSPCNKRRNLVILKDEFPRVNFDLFIAEGPIFEEKADDVIPRAMEFTRLLYELKEAGKKEITVVTHGGFIKCLSYVLTGVFPDKYMGYGKHVTIEM